MKLYWIASYQLPIFYEIKKSKYFWKRQNNSNVLCQLGHTLIYFNIVIRTIFLWDNTLIDTIITTISLYILLTFNTKKTWILMSLYKHNLIAKKKC